MRRGILLFAHGARDPRWAAPFEAVAARVREHDAAREVRLAYLELMAPSIADAGRELALSGCDRVDIVPLFLGAGGHVRQDLPTLVRDLEQAHPLVQWRLHPAIGELQSVIAAMADAAHQLASEHSLE
ncbi:MAG TPA: CbiX/SirB N-terminal domain-containing protein [Burkholderiaceae bacterium]|nr:CbiX/SirB N-terminal domain-containing protein [Burkholderiaceae bacterium]